MTPRTNRRFAPARRTDRTKPFGGFTTVTGLGAATDDERDPYLMKGRDLPLHAAAQGRIGRERSLPRSSRNSAACPAAIAALNTTNSERDPVLSEDGLEIFYAFGPLAEKGTFRVLARHAEVPTDPFGAPVAIVELSDQLNVYDAPTWISVDRCVLYMASDRDTNTRLYSAVRDAEHEQKGCPDPANAIVERGTRRSAFR